MSYILDALKKIEHEKNKKRSDGRLSVASDLFQERKQPASRAGIWKIAVLIAGASLVTGGGTWFALHGKNTGSVVAVRPLTPPQAVPAIPPVVVPPVPMPAPIPAPIPVQAVAPPSVVPSVVPSPAAAAPQETSEDREDDDSRLSRKARRAIARGKAQPVVQKPATQAVQTVQPVQVVAAPADLKLSGIAWQDERAGRRAVINGFLLKEGAVVSGAKIIDIQADRVRFSSAGGQFEMRLDAVLPAEVKK
jgi:general secretion pathway protein B